MEDVLERVEMYGNKLSAQIHNIKKLVRTNQNVVAQLRANEKTLKSLVEGRRRPDQATRKPSIRANRATPRSLKAVLRGNGACEQESSKQLLGLRTESVWQENCACERRASTQLLGVRNRMNSIEEEMERLRPPLSLRSPRCEACKVACIEDIVRTLCKPTTEGCLPQKRAKKAECSTDMPCVRQALYKSVKIDLDNRQKGGRDAPAPALATYSRDVDQVRHQKLIERVENILESVENLHIKTETVSDVKILCNLVLGALMQEQRSLHIDCKPPHRCEMLQRDNDFNEITFSKVCLAHKNPYI